jgi:hypothetical protein
VRREQSARVVHELEAWLRTQRDRTSRKSEIGKAVAQEEPQPSYQMIWV